MRHSVNMFVAPNLPESTRSAQFMRRTFIHIKVCPLVHGVHNLSQTPFLSPFKKGKLSDQETFFRQLFLLLFSMLPFHHLQLARPMESAFHC